MTTDDDTAAALASDERFTDHLRERSEPDWTAATEHRFAREVGAGTIDDAVFRRYLVQDYAFVETLVRVIGSAVAQAPSTREQAELAAFLDTVTGDEDDYFGRSFDALDVPDGDRTDPDLAPVTREFRDHLLAAARTGGYAETLAVLVPAEWVYFEWASAAAQGEMPDPFHLAEWIDLHANPGFRDVVAWLRAELDREAPELAPRRRDRIERLFERTVELEVGVFDMAYGETPGRRDRGEH
jgi:thiaminase/transcriptional activator TenA